MSFRAAERARSYLEHLEKLAKTILGDNLVSLVLFGSLARNELSKSSDIDVLIVVRDRHHPSVVEFTRELYRLELTFGFPFNSKGFFGKLFYALSRATGMFRASFVTDIEAIKNWKFSSVFNTSEFLTKLLAPREAVKFTILSSYKILYGPDPLGSLDVKTMSSEELIKSFLMNLLLATASLIILPLNREAYKFIYEAVKWSLFCYAYAARRKPEIEKLLEVLRKTLGKTIDSFAMIRKNGELNPDFVLHALPLIIKIHIQAIKELKRGLKRIASQNIRILKDEPRTS